MDGEAAERHTKERLRTRWTASLDKIFTDLVVEQIKLGNRRNNIFDKKTWGHIRDEFNVQTSLNFNNNQLRKHLDVLRTRYNQAKSALDQNDFVLEDSGCISFDLWEGIGVNSGSEPVKPQDCPIYEQLCIIFADNGADGMYAQSSHYEEMERKPCESNAVGSTSCPETGEQLPYIHDTPSSLKFMKANSDLDGKRNSQNKRKHSLEPQQNVRSQIDEEILNSMAQALVDMIAASKLRMVAAACDKKEFSITKCINALDEIEGIGDSLYLAALDLFDDINSRTTFVSLQSNEIRLQWLQRQCYSAAIY